VPDEKAEDRDLTIDGQVGEVAIDQSSEFSVSVAESMVEFKSMFLLADLHLNTFGPRL